MPGDNVSVDIELQKPVAMEKGQRFAIREGGRTIVPAVCRKSSLNAKNVSGGGAATRPLIVRG